MDVPLLALLKIDLDVHPTSTGSTHSSGPATGLASGDRARQCPRCQQVKVPASPGWRCKGRQLQARHIGTVTVL